MWYQLYLDDDKHVVYADAEHQERDDGMNGTVNNSHVKAETVRGQNGLSNHRDAHDGQDQLANDEIIIMSLSI